MPNRITWPKDQIAKAKELGESLFAIGYMGEAGRWEAMGPCPDDKAQMIFVIAVKIQHGATLDEAVAYYKEIQEQINAKKT